MFESLWKTFDLRFQTILESMKKHRDLVDREANTMSITEAKAWRNQQLADIKHWQAIRNEEIERQERERSVSNVRESVAWLGATTEQEDLYVKLVGKTEGQRESWIFQHPIITKWLDPLSDIKSVWLHGKPGGGKHCLQQAFPFLLKELGASGVYEFSID